MFGTEALKYILDNYEFKTVLDIGCGSGEQAKVFKDNKKEVTELDTGDSIYAKNRSEGYIQANYLNYKFDKKFDAIWASHVLEHQKNVNQFLRKVNEDLKENGILAITVPPAKKYIVGGHLTLWNAGLVLYNLVVAGMDCREAKIKKYDYNISVMIKKKSIKLPKLTNDHGDLNRIIQFFPKELVHKNKAEQDIMEGFNGDIKQLNWNKEGIIYG